MKMWRAGGGKGINPEGGKKSPFTISQCVYHIFFPFFLLCCKDEIQMAQINVERNANKSFIARDIQSSFFFLQRRLKNWMKLCISIWVSHSHAWSFGTGRSLWKTDTRVEPARTWIHREAQGWPMAWVSWHCSFGAFRENLCSEMVPSGHSSSWTSPPTANTTLHMDPPVLQWALRAAAETPPGLWKYYCMESHELLRTHQGDYSCTGFQTTWKGPI